MRRGSAALPLLLLVGLWLFALRSARGGDKISSVAPLRGNVRSEKIERRDLHAALIWDVSMSPVKPAP